MSTHKKPKAKPASKRMQPASKVAPKSVGEMQLQIIQDPKAELKRRVKLGIGMLSRHPEIVLPILEGIALDRKTSANLVDKISAKLSRFNTRKPPPGDEDENDTEAWTRKYLYSLRTSKEHRISARKWWDSKARLEMADGAGAILDEFKAQDEAQP